MKKAITTYPNMPNKFNPGGFKKQLQSFYDWDKKKKAHIKQMEREKLEKEKELLKNPEINTEANLKYNTNPKNYDAVERLYHQDLQRREEKKIALTKIYTPTFKPKLYTNKYNLGKVLQQNNNTKTERKIKIKINKKLKNQYKEEVEENEMENRNNDDNANNVKSKDNNKDKINNNVAKRNKTVNNFNENEKKVRKGENNKKEKENKTTNKNNSKQRKNLSQKKKTITWKLTDDENGEDSNEEEKKKIKKVKFSNRNTIESKFRELLFKKMKPIARRNNSVGRRNKF